MSTDDLAAQILKEPALEGLTVSGGEPFSQAFGLAVLIDAVRAEADLGVIVYTGFEYERLVDGRAGGDPHAWGALLDRVDLLVDGPYVRELNDGRSLRGSSNQRAFALTDRYRAALATYGVESRSTEIHMLHDEVVLVGIPGQATLAHWRRRFRPGSHEHETLRGSR